MVVERSLARARAREASPFSRASHWLAQPEAAILFLYFCSALTAAVLPVSCARVLLQVSSSSAYARVRAARRHTVTLFCAGTSGDSRVKKTRQAYEGAMPKLLVATGASSLREPPGSPWSSCSHRIIRQRFSGIGNRIRMAYYAGLPSAREIRRREECLASQRATKQRKFKPLDVGERRQGKWHRIYPRGLIRDKNVLWACASFRVRLKQ